MAADYTDSLKAFRDQGLDIPLDAAARTAWVDKFNKLPGIARFGVRVELDDTKLVKASLRSIEEHHRGGLGTSAVNGAVIAGLFDCALGVAGTLHFLGRRAGTCELSLKFMHAVFGPEVEAYAIATKVSQAIAFVESRLYSGGRISAVATGIVAVAKTMPKEGEELRW